MSSSKLWPVFALIIVAVPEAQVVHAQEPSMQEPSANAVFVVDKEAPAEPEFTVDALVQHALASSPQLPVARHNEEAARQRLGAARAFPNPILELVPRLASDREAADEEVILSQPLDIFGRRRAQAGVVRAELRRAQAESTEAERSLIVNVKNAAADLFASQEAEALGEVQAEVAQLFRDAAARRAELGDVPPVQVQRAELELLRVQNEVTVARAERLVRRATLNQLIGQAPQTPLRVVLTFPAGASGILRARPNASVLNALPDVTQDEANRSRSGSAVPMSTTKGPNAAQVVDNLAVWREQVLPDALANRPDVIGAQATIEARRAQADVLRRERLPQVEIQARRSSFFGSEGAYGVRAVVTVPLFDFGSNKRERRALEAQARAQDSTVALLRSQIAAEVEGALLRLQQQQQTAERYRTGIVPLTLDLLRKTQIGYAAGASTYLEVLEAQRTLRQVQTEYLQALVGTRSSEAQLEGALGAAAPAGLLSNITNPTAAAMPPGIAAPGMVPERATNADSNAETRTSTATEAR